MPNDQMDRAQWKKFQAGDKNFCFCGQRAQVSVSLTATELNGDRGKMLVATKEALCNDHALLRYGKAKDGLAGKNGG